MSAKTLKIIFLSLALIFVSGAAHSLQIQTCETPPRSVESLPVEAVSGSLIAERPQSMPSLSITIVESQSSSPYHDMDLEWQTVATAMGHTATIVQQTVLDNTAFFATTDILIVSSGVIPIPSNRRTIIQQYIQQGGPVYIQGEYTSIAEANQTFQQIVNALGGSFSWGSTINGDLQPMTVLGTLSSTPNSVPSLSYFWYGCTGSGNSTIENFLTYSGLYFGFIFTPPNSSYGKVICDSDQDWVRDFETHPEGHLLMENILTNLAPSLCCDVNMVPDTSPVFVHPGASFGLTGYIGNPTSNPIQTDVWVGVWYNNTFYQLWYFPNIPLNPGQTISAHLNQAVPGYAPLGTYSYMAYCGDYPSTKCDSAQFNFTVYGGVAGNAENWAVDGAWDGVQMVTTQTPTYRTSPSEKAIEQSETHNLPTIASYTPGLQLSFPSNIINVPMSMVSDGNYLYANDGGWVWSGSIVTYDLNGNFIQSVYTYLDTRGFFYNPNNGKFYIKDFWNGALWDINPATGASTVYMSGIFYNSQSCLAYDPASNLMYEMANDTVYAIDFATGSLVNIWTGINGTYAIAYNGCSFFTRNWDDSVHVYNTNFNYLESIILPTTGWDNGYSLSFANGLLWEIETDPDHVAYGYYGCACQPLCCDVNMVSDTLPIFVHPGGSFGLTGYIGNPTPNPIQTDVWVGVWYNNSFYQLWNFPNIPLNPAQTLSAHLNQAVPGYAPLGTYSYMAYCGDYPSTKCDSAQFNFTVYGAGVEGGNNDWVLQGSFGQDYPIENALLSNYPNPFNVTTTITYSLPAADQITLDVFNLGGQKVASLINGYKAAGKYTVTWDASRYTSGIYFYRLATPHNTQMGRMVLLK